MSLYWIKTIKGKKQRVWNTGRCRGIKEYSERIDNFLPKIKKLLNKKEKIRILDIGCGYGKTLMELKKEFDWRIEIYGINLEKRWTLNLIRKFGLAEKIFTKREINKNLPKLYIGDAGKKLPYKNNYFDFIMSVASAQYIYDKARFLEEINRVLSKQGIAIIELQEKKKNYPPEFKNLFEVWKNNRRIDSISHLKKFKSLTIKNSKEWGWSYLIIKKSKNLKLNLMFINSIDLNKINPDWWGVKSVFLLK